MSITTLLGLLLETPSQDTVQKLSDREICEYASNKQVVLFGEIHGDWFVNDDLAFLRLLPCLKEKGFTDVGLEIGSEYQSLLQKYWENPTLKKEQKMKEEIEKRYPTDFAEGILLKTRFARNTGLEIQAIDKPEKKGSNYNKRDEYMKKRIDKLVDKGKRIAVFIGLAHVRDVSEQVIYHFSFSFTPLGYRLVQEYGKENIGLVSLTDCDPYVEVCLEERI